MPVAPAQATTGPQVPTGTQCASPLRPCQRVNGCACPAPSVLSCRLAAGPRGSPSEPASALSGNPRSSMVVAVSRLSSARCLRMRASSAGVWTMTEPGWAASWEDFGVPSPSVASGVRSSDMTLLSMGEGWTPGRRRTDSATAHKRSCRVSRRRGHPGRMPGLPTRSRPRSPRSIWVASSPHSTFVAKITITSTLGCLSARVAHAGNPVAANAVPPASADDAEQRLGSRTAARQGQRSPGPRNVQRTFGRSNRQQRRFRGGT